jgi:hypothetical protein
MNNLTQNFKTVLSDQLGKDFWCYIIDAQTLQTKEINFTLKEIKNVKCLHQEIFTGQNKAWPTQTIENHYALLEYENKSLLMLFKIDVYDYNIISISAHSDIEIFNSLKYNYKKIEQVANLDFKDPFNQKVSLIMLEKYLIDKSLKMVEKSKTKIKI